jgi:SAM-dependent methyltransferase
VASPAPHPPKDGLRSWLRRAKYLGWARHCPICGSHVRRFRPAGVVPRPDVVCPICGSYERHRLLWVFLTTRTDLLGPRRKRVLHVAPEPILAARLQRHPAIEYVSADLHDPSAAVAMDLTRIPFRDGAFDVVLCSHVLEHVPDDRTAMEELRRVLRASGWAILQVPIEGTTTDEDPAVQDPAERERRFGQRDHVRRYGTDYRERLRRAGFEVRTFAASDVVGRQNVRRMGIMADEDVHYCTRRALQATQ